MIYIGWFKYVYIKKLSNNKGVKIAYNDQYGMLLVLGGSHFCVKTDWFQFFHDVMKS
jgi:hypothetical protein